MATEAVSRKPHLYLLTPTGVDVTELQTSEKVYADVDGSIFISKSGRRQRFSTIERAIGGVEHVIYGMVVGYARGNRENRRPSGTGNYNIDEAKQKLGFGAIKYGTTLEILQRERFEVLSCLSNASNIITDCANSLNPTDFYTIVTPDEEKDRREFVRRKLEEIIVKLCDRVKVAPYKGTVEQVNFLMGFGEIPDDPTYPDTAFARLKNGEIETVAQRLKKINSIIISDIKANPLHNGALGHHFRESIQAYA